MTQDTRDPNHPHLPRWYGKGRDSCPSLCPTPIGCSCQERADQMTQDNQANKEART